MILVWDVQEQTTYPDSVSREYVIHTFTNRQAALQYATILRRRDQQQDEALGGQRSTTYEYEVVPRRVYEDEYEAEARD